MPADSNTVYIRSIMRLTGKVRSISYLKARAAELVREVTATQEPLVITQNGEARAVIQDVASYEETQETLALLKLLALGSREIEEGEVAPIEDVVERIRARRKKAP